MGIALTSNTLFESDLSFKYRHGPKIRLGASGDGSPRGKLLP